MAITFFIFHVGRPLWREDESVICSAMTQVQFQVKLRPTVCWPVRFGAGPPMGLITRFYFLCLTVTSSSRCRAPSPISPANRVIQPKVKVTLVQGEICNVTTGRTTAVPQTLICKYSSSNNSQGGSKVSVSVRKLENITCYNHQHKVHHAYLRSPRTRYVL
jgi:hypothetical protein